MPSTVVVRRRRRRRRRPLQKSCARCHNAPSKLGNLAHKVEVRSFLHGLGINVDQTNVVPQTDLLAFRRFRLHAVFEGVFFALGGNINIRVGAERALLLELAHVVEGNKGFNSRHGVWWLIL